MIDKKAQHVIESSINKIIKELERNNFVVCSKNYSIYNNASAGENITLDLDININGVLIDDK